LANPYIELFITPDLEVKDTTPLTALVTPNMSTGGLI
jgi:hypothetical protein